MDTIPVFILSDDNYAAALAALILSVVDNTKSEISFYIIDNGLSNLHRRYLEAMRDTYNLRLELIRSADYRYLFSLPPSSIRDIERVDSDKFLIPCMKPDLDKVIVLDADMLAIGDIRELWETEMDGKTLAAVPFYGCRSIGQIYDIVREGGVNPTHFYFNIGTLVIDLKKWRENEMSTKLFNYQIDFDPKKIRRWDEVVLNLLLEINNYKLLDPRFNMTITHLLYYHYNQPYKYKQVIEEHFKLDKNYLPPMKSGLIHFQFRDMKPYNTRLCSYMPTEGAIEIPYFKMFWYYLKQTPFYDGELVSFYDRRVEAARESVKADTKRRTQNLLTYNKLMHEYKRNRMWSRLTLGLVSKYSKRKRKCHEELKRLERLLGL